MDRQLQAERDYLRAQFERHCVIPLYLLDTPCSWCGERIVFPDKHECEPDEYWRIEEAGRKRFEFNQRMGW